MYVQVRPRTNAAARRRRAAIPSLFGGWIALTITIVATQPTFVGAESPKKSLDTPIDALRRQQQQELDAARANLRKQATQPDITPEQFDRHLNDYHQQVKAIQEKYNAQDTRNERMGEMIRQTGARPTGSKTKDVRADLDSAGDRATNEKVLKNMRDRGHNVEVHASKYVDRTDDATHWREETPKGRAEIAKDFDAYRTAGGMNAVGNKNEPKDAAGEIIDHRSKFEHARGDGDAKTMGKGLAKSMEAADPIVFDPNGVTKFPARDRKTGEIVYGEDGKPVMVESKNKGAFVKDKGAFGRSLGADAEAVYKQAKGLQEYQDPVAAGTKVDQKGSLTGKAITSPADSPAVENKKLSKWADDAQALTEQAQKVGNRRGERRDMARQDNANSYRNANPADPKVREWNQESANLIESNRNRVRETNQTGQDYLNGQRVRPTANEFYSGGWKDGDTAHGPDQKPAGESQTDKPSNTAESGVPGDAKGESPRESEPPKALENLPRDTKPKSNESVVDEPRTKPIDETTRPATPETSENRPDSKRTNAPDEAGGGRKGPASENPPKAPQQTVPDNTATGEKPTSADHPADRSSGNDLAERGSTVEPPREATRRAGSNPSEAVTGGGSAPARTDHENAGAAGNAQASDAVPTTGSRVEGALDTTVGAAGKALDVVGALGIGQKVGEGDLRGAALDTARMVIPRVASKAAGEVFMAADSIRGSVQEINQKLSDKREAEAAINHAQAWEYDAWSLGVGKQLLRAGVSKSEIREIMSAMRNGDDSLAKRKAGELNDRGISISVPGRPVVANDVVADDDIFDRMAQHGDAILQPLRKFGQDVSEIGGSTVSIIGDGLHSAQEDRKRSATNAYLLNKLVQMGADPEEAGAAVKAFDKGDRNAIRSLQSRLNDDRRSGRADAPSSAGDASDFANPFSVASDAGGRASGDADTSSPPLIDLSVFARGSQKSSRPGNGKVTLDRAEAQRLDQAIAARDAQTARLAAAQQAAYTQSAGQRQYNYSGQPNYDDAAETQQWDNVAQSLGNLFGNLLGGDDNCEDGAMMDQ